MPNVGEVYDGQVTSIKNYGAFIEVLPGTEGLCHVSEMAAGYVQNPEDVVSVGDTVKVKVLDIEEGSGRIRLSMKQADPNFVAEAVGVGGEGGEGGSGPGGSGGGQGGAPGGRGGRDSGRGHGGGGGDRGGRGGRGGGGGGGRDRGPLNFLPTAAADYGRKRPARAAVSRGRRQCVQTAERGTRSAECGARDAERAGGKIFRRPLGPAA